MNKEYENNKDWSDSGFMDAVAVILFFGFALCAFIYLLAMIAMR